METIEVKVEIREGSGKGPARALRRAGRIPAILYGPGRSAVSLALDAGDFETRVGALEGSHLIRLRSPVADLGGRLALVKDLQRHPVTSALLHADLYEVDVDTKIRVNVPLHFVGKAKGVELGGILQPIRREVEVSCLPTEIPEFIEVDVSELGVNEALHVSQLGRTAGVEILLDEEMALVTVLPPVVEEVKVAAAAAGEGVTAPEAGAAEAGKA